MSNTLEVAERDGWRCWLCDQPVSRRARPGTVDGPSVDHVQARSRGGRRSADNERLAHGRCNTRRGSAEPTIPWPDELQALDVAPLWPTLQRLERKGGRELVGMFPTEAHGRSAAEWLEGRAERITRRGWATDVEDRSGIWVLYLEPALV